MSNASVDPWACFHVYAQKSLLISENGIIFDIFLFRLFLNHSGMHAGRSLYLFTTGCPKKKVGLADKLTNIAPNFLQVFWDTL